MIREQEGGPGHTRLAVPGEEGDWVARNLLPPPSQLLSASSVPAGSTFSRAPRAGAPRGAGAAAEGAEPCPYKETSFECDPRICALIGRGVRFVTFILIHRKKKKKGERRKERKVSARLNADGDTFSRHQISALAWF